MKSHDLYLKTKPSSLFRKTAIPGGISMLASSLYSVFDSVFVGKYLGTTAFAALGLAIPLIIINFALSELVGVGSSVPISIYLGKKQDEEADNYFTCAILLIILTGCISGSLIYQASPLFLSLMGAEGELLHLSVKYARVYAVFSPLTPLMFAMDNFLRISGRMKTSMFLNIFTSALTIILELLLILVIPMGIVGAALGSCLAMLGMVFLSVSMFLPGKLQLKLVRPRFSRELLISIYKNGAAPFLTNLSGRVFSVCMNILLLRFGGAPAVAIYGVCMTLSSIIEQLIYGITDSLQPAIGYNYGAKEYGRVKSLEIHVLFTGAFLSAVGAVLLFLVPDALATPFLEDLTLLPEASAALRILSVSYLFRWFTVSIQCLFMAVEEPLKALILSVSSACILPLIVLLTLLPLRLTGLWWNYSVTAILTAFMSYILLRTSALPFFSSQNDKTRLPW